MTIGIAEVRSVGGNSANVTMAGDVVSTTVGGLVLDEGAAAAVAAVAAVAAAAAAAAAVVEHDVVTGEEVDAETSTEEAADDMVSVRDVMSGVVDNGEDEG